MRKTARLPHCLLSFLPGERGVSFLHVTVSLNFADKTEEPRKTFLIDSRPRRQGKRYGKQYSV